MIFALMGRSGAGKSTIAKEIIQNTSLDEILTWTTRPIRSGEASGKDYHFTSDEGFDRMLKKGNIVAHKYIEARDWHYGINISDIQRLGDDKHAVVIVSPDGYNELKTIFGSKVMGLFIETEEKTLLRRCITREENPDIFEISRRYIADKSDFRNINYDFKIDNNGDFEKTVSHITSLINTVLYGSKQV